MDIFTYPVTLKGGQLEFRELWKNPEYTERLMSTKPDQEVGASTIPEA